jgi:hypothetical protein
MSPGRQRAIAISGLVAGVAAIGLAVYKSALEAGGFADAMGCQKIVHVKIPSPTSTLNAWIFELECGATTGFNTQLSIVPTKERLDYSRFPPAVVVDGKGNIEATWLSPTELAVSLAPSVKVYTRKAESNGVVLRYSDKR